MSFARNMKITSQYQQALGRLSQLTLVALLGVGLSGCGYFWGEDGMFRNRENDYLKAESIPPLVLPPEVHSESMGELYPIPAISTTDLGYDPSADEFEVPRPLPLADNLQEEKVKIQRVGDESWILLNVSPGEVWPRIRNFLNVNDLTVSRADIAKGIIETNWLQFKTDPNTYDRYRLQIDQGVQPETSEIHVTHMSVPTADINKPAADFPRKSDNSEREKWLMTELANSLASDTSEGGTSLLAQEIGGSVKASLNMSRGEPVLTIRLDHDRAMATLGHAAQKDGFTTFEADPESGIFYINYEDPEESKPGWFKRTFHIGLHPKAPTTPYTLAQIKTNMLTGDEFVSAPQSNRKKEKVNPKAPGYLLVTLGRDGNYVVYIRDPYGKRLSLHETRLLLTILRKNLI